MPRTAFNQQLKVVRRLLEQWCPMSRLSPKKNDLKSDCKREDPVDKDKELRVVELALVAQGVLIVGGHDLLLEVAPSAVGPQQSQRAENHLSLGFTVLVPSMNKEKDIHSLITCMPS